MSVINIEGWKVEHVGDWISGLDTALTAYANNFIKKGIDGKRLLNLMAGDLVAIGVDKVGDQVLLADAIQSLRNELESVTLQTLASNVSVRSKNLRNFTARAKKNFVSNESLASASYLLDAGKTLLRWLTRFPFVGVPLYDEITHTMGKHLFELAYICKRDSFADNAIEEVQYLCTKIIEICENIINIKDSLTIQPAAVDVITIRKRHEQELGLQFESSYFGLHMVSGVSLTSPAQQSGHLERGDEILQVNYQTVVGWTQAALVNLLYENPCEVVLTVKRRPRHASTGLGHMYLRPSKLPGRNSNKTNHRDRQLGAGTIHPNPILEVEDDDEAVIIDDHKKSTPDDTLTVEEESTSGGAITYSAAETRFWKLYPKPRNLLKRRATVTGSSPTSTRPPVTFTSESSTSQQKSSMSSSQSRHRLDKCISAPERNKLEKQNQVEETLRLFVGDSNVRGSRVTLPCIGSTTFEPSSSSQQLDNKSNIQNLSSNNIKVKGAATSSREYAKLCEEPHREDSLDDVFEAPPTQEREVTPIIVTTCSISSSSTLTVITPKTPTTTITTTCSVTPFSGVNASTLTSNSSSPRTTPTPTTPTIIKEVMKTREPIIFSEIPPSTVKTQVSISKLSSPSPTNTAITTPSPLSITPVSPKIVENDAVDGKTRVPLSLQEKRQQSVDMESNTPVHVSAQPTLESTTRIPPSSINLAQQVSVDDSISSEKSDPLYTGYLHQRQPHWKFGGPRWSRCRASIDSQCFRLLKRSGSGSEMEILLNSYNFSLANEVHSRPFAFKMEDKKDKAIVHYFAAESHAELSIWMGYLNIEGGAESPRRGSAFLNRSMSVQPDVQRSFSTPSSEKMQRRSSLPHSQPLQYQFRKKLSKLQMASSCSVSTSSMEDKLKFWNSSPTGSPTHYTNSNSKSNISSITITSCKRNQQQQQEVPKSNKPLETSQRANNTKAFATIIPNSESEISMTENTTNTTPIKSSATLVKKSSLDSPTKKCRVGVTMGTTMLLKGKERKCSDSVNNNDILCGNCGRSLSSQDKSTQTEELVLIFNATGDAGESRI